MIKFIKDFLITLAIFLTIDFVWLGIIAKSFYDKYLAPFSRTLRWPAAIGAYLLLALGITVFVLPKANSNPLQALVWGALFGLIAYGVYDFSNFATLADWSIKVVMVDMLWGATICGLTSFLVSLILNWLK